ncbi:MAG: hypothetical protein PHT69_16780 [Bacteroidales bacterium]|nr:hypothetical protein [Bacteroidales bacterium]
MKSIFEKINRFRLILNTSGITLGIIGGYLYYHFYACESGCPLNSTPYMSIIWGGLLGYLISDLFYKKN